MSYRENLRMLRTMVDPQILCQYLSFHTDGGQKCDHTFSQTMIYINSYANVTNPETVIQLLNKMEAECDCQVIQKICATEG